jgi:hypothetical protein
MNAPLSVIVVPVPVGTGDKGCWRKATPHDRRHHRDVRSEQWRPQENIPERDPDRLRRLVDQMREAHRPQAEALLAQGRAMLSALKQAA